MDMCLYSLYFSVPRPAAVYKEDCLMTARSYGQIVFVQERNVDPVDRRCRFYDASRCTRVQDFKLEAMVSKSPTRLLYATYIQDMLSCIILARGCCMCIVHGGRPASSDSMAARARVGRRARRQLDWPRTTHSSLAERSQAALAA